VHLMAEDAGRDRRPNAVRKARQRVITCPTFSSLQRPSEKPARLSGPRPVIPATTP